MRLRARRPEEGGREGRRGRDRLKLQRSRQTRGGRRCGGGHGCSDEGEWRDARRRGEAEIVIAGAVLPIDSR